MRITLQNATGHPFKLCLQFIVALAIKVAVIKCSSMPKIGTRLEIAAATAAAAAAVANDVVAVLYDLNLISMCPATMGIEELASLG